MIKFKFRIMKKLTLIVLVFCSAIAYGQNKDVEVKDVEYLKVIELADNLFPTIEIERQEYKLISINNMVIKSSDYQGPHIWHLTYKLKSIIPDDENSIIGAGGEIFIEVNLIENKAKLLGFGE